MTALTPISSLSISFFELLTILGFFGGLITVWIATRVKIAKIEASIQAMRCEFDLKLKAIDSKSLGLHDFLATRLREFVDDNKDDHNEIKENIKGIVHSISEISKEVAKITPSTKKN